MALGVLGSEDLPGYAMEIQQAREVLAVKELQ
jgi:hypothetical protein